MFKSKYPIFKCFQKHQKGFTLIELLVVIAILGVIAAVAVPNITQFMGAGEEEAKLAEQHNVQVAVAAAMADSSSSTVSTPGTLDKDNDVTVSGNYTVGDYIMGGNAALSFAYTVESDGKVNLA